MLSKFLHLHEGELFRLLPFFCLYFVLFSAFTLADGLSIALFVQDIGAEHLPKAYAVIAVLNFLLVLWYFFQANKGKSTLVFYQILVASAVLFLTSWLAVRFLNAEVFGYSLLYISREITSTMILLHFGTYLQDYFTRSEMSRTLPIIYAGGRVGGIAGAVILENFCEMIGLNNLILLISLICLLVIVGVTIISTAMKHQEEEEQPATTDQPEMTAQELEARNTAKGFLRYVWRSRLLFWITWASILFIGCRWLLNFQYNSYFEWYFNEHQFETLFESFTTDGADADVIDMAQFMGRYTQIALTISLLMQLLVVSRVIRWFGAPGTLLFYSSLVLTALAFNFWGLTLTLAVCCRFVENELRLGLRNPVMLLVTNQFSKPVRARVRAWTTGVLVPLATLLAAGLLGFLIQLDWDDYIAVVGVAVGIIYVACVFMMGRQPPQKGN